MKMNKRITLFFALMLTVATVYSCKKDKTEPAPQGTGSVADSPDFTVFGQLYVYQPVRFVATTKKDQQLTWYFGTLAEKTVISNEVTYTFEQAGTYTVSMAVVDGFGGTISKDITITNGTERLAGNINWNFFLKKDKFGQPPGSTPPTSFQKSFSFTIVNDSTIQIPDIAQMPVRGPYTVKKVRVDDKEMVYRSEDDKMEVSYVFGTLTGGIKITQSDADYIWYLTGIATITE